MSKVISNFNLYLYRLRLTYEKSATPEIFKKSLLALYNKLLHKYDEYTCYELKQMYRDNINDFPKDINYAIVYLIVIDIIGTEKLATLNFEIIKSLIETFIKNKINPYNFSKYITVFLDDDIYNMLDYLWIFSDDLSSDLIKLINIYNEHNLGDYYSKAQVLKYLCHLLNQPFSPILKRKYTITGIKECLKFELENMCPNSEDYNTISLLHEIELDFSAYAKDTLIEKLKEIEVNHIKEKEKTIRLMLKEIRKFYDAYISLPKDETVNNIIFLNR